MADNKQQPVHFVTNRGHDQSPDETKKQNKAIAQSNAWTVEGKGKTYGIENIEARKTIQLSGLGRFSGLYYIKQATHKISKAEGYSVEIDVRTSGTGKGKAAKGTSGVNGAGAGGGSSATQANNATSQSTAQKVVFNRDQQSLEKVNMPQPIK